MTGEFGSSDRFEYRINAPAEIVKRYRRIESAVGKRTPFGGSGPLKSGENIRWIAKNNLEVVTQDRVTKNFDSHLSGQKLKSLANPLATMLEVLATDGVFPA